MGNKEVDLLKSMKKSFGPETESQRMNRLIREKSATIARQKRQRRQIAANIFDLLVNNIKGGMFFENCGCKNCKKIRACRLNNPALYNRIAEESGRLRKVEEEGPSYPPQVERVRYQAHPPVWNIPTVPPSLRSYHMPQVYWDGARVVGVSTPTRPAEGSRWHTHVIVEDEEDEEEEAVEQEIRSYNDTAYLKMPSKANIFYMLEHFPESAMFQGAMIQDMPGAPAGFVGNCHAFSAIEGRANWWKSVCGVEVESCYMPFGPVTKKQSMYGYGMPIIQNAVQWTEHGPDCMKCKMEAMKLYITYLSKLGWDGNCPKWADSVAYTAFGRAETRQKTAEARSFFSPGWHNGESFSHLIVRVLPGQKPIGVSNCRHWSGGVSLTHDHRSLQKCSECEAFEAGGRPVEQAW